MPWNWMSWLRSPVYRCRRWWCDRRAIAITEPSRRYWLRAEWRRGDVE